MVEQIFCSCGRELPPKEVRKIVKGLTISYSCRWCGKAFTARDLVSKHCLDNEEKGDEQGRSS